MTREVGEVHSGRAAGDHWKVWTLPMIENYPVFRKFLLPELDSCAGTRAKAHDYIWINFV